MLASKSEILCKRLEYCSSLIFVLNTPCYSVIIHKTANNMESSPFLSIINDIKRVISGVVTLRMIAIDIPTSGWQPRNVAVSLEIDRLLRSRSLDGSGRTLNLCRL